MFPHFIEDMYSPNTRFTDEKADLALHLLPTRIAKLLTTAILRGMHPIALKEEFFLTLISGSIPQRVSRRPAWPKRIETIAHYAFSKT